MAHAVPILPFDTVDPVERDIRWNRWIRMLDFFIVSKGTTDDKVKVAWLNIYGGMSLSIIINETYGDLTTYEQLKERLTAHFKPIDTTRAAAFSFTRTVQFAGEPFDQFLERLRNAAKGCAFTKPTENVLNQAVAGCRSKTLKREIIKTKCATLDQLVALGLEDEAMESQLTLMAIEDEPLKLRAIGSIPQPGAHTSAQPATKSIGAVKPNTGSKACYRCGRQWPHEASSGCPALKAKCANCGIIGHFGELCKKTQHKATYTAAQRPPYQTVRQVQQSGRHQDEYARDEYAQDVDGDKLYDNQRHADNFGRHNNMQQQRVSFKHHQESVDSEAEQEYQEGWGSLVRRVIVGAVRGFLAPMLQLFICQTMISIALDTGADVNIMDRRTFQSLELTPRLEKMHTSIFAYGAQQPMQLLGKFSTRVAVNGVYKLIEFVVTDGLSGNLLSHKSAVELKIMGEIRCVNAVSVVDHAMAKWKGLFPQAFTGLVGKLVDEPVRLHIDHNVPPVQQKLRHVPFHLRPAVEAEIGKMLENDLIEPHTGPTTWISPIVPVPKPNRPGEIRICTDMRAANKGIKRQRHIMPTVDDLVVALNGATFLSKLDLKSGYNQLVLHPDSRHISTFCTHMGLFRYKRLNLGINTASDLFQMAMERVIAGIPGTLNMSDDIIVMGTNIVQHQERLKLVLDRITKAAKTYAQRGQV